MTINKGHRADDRGQKTAIDLKVWIEKQKNTADHIPDHIPQVCVGWGAADSVGWSMARLIGNMGGGAQQMAEIKRLLAAARGGARWAGLPVERTGGVLLGSIGSMGRTLGNERREERCNERPGGGQEPRLGPNIGAVGAFLSAVSLLFLQPFVHYSLL